MSCADFSSTSTVCRTVTLIEPDSTLLVSTSSGSNDQSLDENGSVLLFEAQTSVGVTFITVKAGANYRFEYLYVDALGFPATTQGIKVLPILQTVYGFNVNFTGAPVHDGFVLRWRVIVISFGTSGGLDAPELIYRRMPQAALMTVVLENQRSNTNYGFDELRVENLVDDPSIQTPVAIQVIEKTTGTFTLGVNPTPPTNNYFLSASVPVR